VSATPEPYVLPGVPTNAAPIRLVATDVDGTIVPADGVLSARMRDALRAVEAAGARLVLVSGRPVRWMGELAEQLGHSGTAICGNGAVVYDLHQERILEVRALAPDAALEAVRRLRAVLAAPSFAAETVEGFVHDPSYVPRWDAGLGERARAIEDVLIDDVPVLKLLCRDETSTGDAMLTASAPMLEGLVEVTHSNAKDCLLEVSARGVDKGSTLALVATGWGIAREECLAFGDMPNDVPMLTWAGTSYAVTGGHRVALAATPGRVAPVAHDGVAALLEKLAEAGRFGS
jgi:Cof subfamily protein (haloacid dehalogenase superfamily)